MSEVFEYITSEEYAEIYRKAYISANGRVLIGKQRDELFKRMIRAAVSVGKNRNMK